MRGVPLLPTVCCPLGLARWLCLVLDSAEEALTGQDFIAHPGMPRRSAPRRPVQQRRPSTKAATLMSAKEASLRHLSGRFRKYALARQEDPNLVTPFLVGMVSESTGIFKIVVNKEMCIWTVNVSSYRS